MNLPEKRARQLKELHKRKGQASGQQRQATQHEVEQPGTHAAERQPKPHNLLAIPWVRRFMQSRWYPGIFQWAAMAVFGMIVFELVAGTVNPSRNLGTSLTWVLWWPAIPVLFLVLGRFWCAVCPFGKISDLVRRFAGSERPTPRFLRKYGIWMIDLFFILITWSDHIWGIVESPRGSGYLLLLLTTMVVATSVFYERRTFCKTLCFLGGLAGNYSRTGMLELRGTPDICKTCKTQSCYKGNDKTEGCPMFQYMRSMETSADCNLCGNCVKSCPNGSIRLTSRAPASELWGIRNPKLEHAFLAAVIMGIVFVQNVTMLGIWQNVLAGISRVTGTQNYVVDFTLAFLAAMLIPIGLLWGAAALIASREGRVKIKESFVRFGYAIIPLDLAGHLAHNLFHALTEGKAIWWNTLALFGTRISGGTSFLPMETVQLLQYAVVLAGLFGSLYTVYRIGQKGAMLKLLPYYGLMVLLAVINLYLFSLPMSHRV